MNLEELFLQKMQELGSAEMLLVKALPAMVKASDNAELQAAFQHHLKQTEQQTTRIDQAFASLRQEPETKACKPMKALIEDAAIASKVEPAGVIRDIAMLGAAQRIEHFEIAAYFSAISLAKTLGYGDAANLLVENLLEEQKAADHLKKISKTLLKQAQEDHSR